jgi:hypothetical protein
MAADWPALAGGVGGGPDPWAERDRLASGSPVQITSLAQAFAKAAGEARTATGLGQQASRLTAEGFRQGGTPVHDIDGVVGSPVDLGHDSARRTELRPEIISALYGWEARDESPCSSADVDLGEYDTARATTRSDTWDGPGLLHDSAWNGGDGPEDLAYGRGAGGEVEPDRPDDPRVLDDPNYDRISDRMRN